MSYRFMGEGAQKVNKLYNTWRNAHNKLQAFNRANGHGPERANLANAERRAKKAYKEAANRNITTLHGMLRFVKQKLNETEKIGFKRAQMYNTISNRIGEPGITKEVKNQMLRNMNSLRNLRDRYYRRERVQLEKEKERLQKAINLRNKMLKTRPMNNRETKAKRVISKALGPSIHRLLYGPYGTRTLEGARRFPGYRPPTNEEYAEARREINRLHRLLEVRSKK